MLAELTIIPLTGDTQMGDEIAEVLKLIDASGLPYQLNPAGTCIEGDWDEVMPLVRRCHERVRELSPHVMTMIKIEDEAGASNKLTRNVDSIQERVGHPLGRLKTLVTPGTPPAAP